MFRSITNNTSKNLSAGGTISGDVTIDGDLTVNGGGGFSYSEVLTGDMIIDQNANAKALTIDSQSADHHILFIDAPVTAGAAVIRIDGAGALTTGHLFNANITSTALATTANDGAFKIDHTANSTSNVNNLMYLHNNHASSTGTTVLKLVQDSTGYALNAVSTTAADVTVANFQSAIDANGEHSIIRVGHSSKAAYMGLLLNSADTAYFGIDDNPDDGNGIYINESGQTGIGTKAPSQMLHIAHATDASIQLERVDTSVADDDAIGAIIIRGGESSQTDVARIRINADEDWTSSSSPTKMIFETTPSGATADAVRMTIDSAGNVGIGENDPSSWNALAHNLVVYENGNSGITIGSGTTGTGSLYFGDGIGGDAAYKGSIEYVHGSTNELRFRANSVIKLVLDPDSRISLSNNDSGTSNTIFGKNAGLAGLSGGTHNVLVGEDAGNDMTTADHNTAVGYQSMDLITTLADGNTAVGYQSLHGNITTQNIDNCVAIGKNTLNGALQSTASGTVAIGVQALSSLTTGARNIAIGYQSSYYNLTGSDNTYLGYWAGSGASGSHSNNVGIGSSALGVVSTGSSNTVIGGFAGDAVTTQDSLTLVGKNAGGAINHNDANGTVAVGASALAALTSGGSNTAVGYQSGTSLVDGNNNSILGFNAGYSLTEGLDNVAVGYGALYGENDGDQCVAIGSMALNSQTGVSGPVRNTAIGYKAGYAVTTGIRNVIIGTDAAVGMQDADECVVIGNYAMGANATQDGTVAIGRSALAALTSGQYNTAIGYNSMDEHTTGRANTCLGWGTMSQSGGDVTAQDNTFIGASSGGGDWAGAGVDQNTAVGYSTMTGAMNGANNNTALGVHALEALTTGDANTALGSEALKANEGGSYNIAIGYQSMLVHTGGLRNVAIGAFAMKDTDSGSPPKASDDCVLIGYDAGGGTWANQDCSNLIGIGTSALAGALEGDTADGAIAIGRDALTALTSGAGSIAIGYQAGDAITSGDYNTAIGYEALGVEDDGDKSTAIGYQALTAQTGTTGTVGNTAIGFQAGNNITTGIENTIVGAFSTISAVGGQNQTVIGSGVTGQANNSVTLGNASVTAVYMASDSGALVHTAGIQFPATQVANGGANVLDDYEEGEHPTAITGATSGSWVLDSAQNKLSYTKIGRMVTVVGKFETDSGSGAGSLRISLPFTSANLTSGAGIAIGSITINRYGSTSIATQITPIIFEGTNYLNVQYHNTDGTSNEGYVQANDIDAIFEGQLSITYFTD